MTKVEHLVKHRVGETLNPGDTIPDFANHADILPGCCSLCTRDLSFKFLE